MTHGKLLVVSTVRYSAILRCCSRMMLQAVGFLTKTGYSLNGGMKYFTKVLLGLIRRQNNSLHGFLSFVRHGSHNSHLQFR